jgi:hypothetical protein
LILDLNEPTALSNYNAVLLLYQSGVIIMFAIIDDVLHITPLAIELAPLILPPDVGPCQLVLVLLLVIGLQKTVSSSPRVIESVSLILLWTPRQREEES